MNDSQVPYISIIINNYNYARFLRQSIDSALQQTYRQVEVVVVDDGSSDDSREIIRGYGNSIKYVFKENGGQGSAYNAGFRACSGQFIMYLDSDDMIKPTAIEESVAALAPDVAKLHYHLKVVEGPDATPTNASVPAGSLPHGDLKPQLLEQGTYISPPASGNIYSRKALESILPMPEEEFRTHADMYCIFLSPFFGMVRAINADLGYYRVHGGNCDAQTEVSPQLLRYRLAKEHHRDSILLKFCQQSGYSYTAGSVKRDINYHKYRLASLAVDPKHHPLEQDRKFKVLTEALLCCYKNQDFPVFKKLLFSGWMVVLAYGPTASRMPMLNLGFVPSKRSKYLQHLVSARS